MSVSAVFGAVVGVAQSALESLATVLTPLVGGLSGALAIVLCTLAVRLLISPLTYLQVRGERRRAALAPQIEKLRRKHQNDPVALAGETIALQRAAGAGPFVSLLPGLAQAPFFMLMFRLVRPGAGVVTGLLTGTLLGVPLTAHLLTGHAVTGHAVAGHAVTAHLVAGHVVAVLPVFAALLAVAVLLAFWSSRRMRRTATGELTGLARVLPLLPYGTVLAIAILPLAGGLYLVTSTAWTALEHLILRGPVTAGDRPGVCG
jgi:YidC/Oxa1 family membrane protein insertase